MSVILAGLAALFYGAADFSGGLATRRGALLPVLLLSQLAGGGLAILLVLAGGAAAPTTSDLAWGLVAGASGAAGLAMLYKGLARSLVALVSPATALIGAVLPVLVALASGERPGPTALVGAAICLPAIVLLSSERGGAVDRAAVRRALTYAVLAGVPIGGFFVALAHTSPASGLWPVLAARAASIPLVLGAAGILRQRLAFTRTSAWPAVAAGLADMAANALFLLATRDGLVSLAVVVASLYPAPTVLLARLFFGERIPATRVAGLGLAIGGIALISLR